LFESRNEIVFVIFELLFVSAAKVPVNGAVPAILEVMHRLWDNEW